VNRPRLGAIALAMADSTFTITITQDQIDHAVATACSQTYIDDDGDVQRTDVDLRTMVRKRLAAKVDAEIAKVTTDLVREVVEERVSKALDDGFPVHSQWGERSGTKTLSEIVGEMVFRRSDNYQAFDLHRFIREQAQAHAKDVVAKAVKSASADIDQMFKDAAAEGIAAMLKKRLGGA